MVSIANILFNKYKGVELSYEELPECAVMAVKTYLIRECGNYIYPDEKFGFVNIPLYELKEAIEKAFKEKWSTFEKYHKWYMSFGDIIYHDIVWAIIINDDKEIILDGWHRFHSYVELNLEVIPVVYLK